VNREANATVRLPSNRGPRVALLLVVVAAIALSGPAHALAGRPNIDTVVVSRDDDGIVTFRIDFAEPVIMDPDDNVQVAIDADRDPGTGVDGLDYSLDQTGPLFEDSDQAALLTAVDGEPVASYPSSLRFSRTAGGTFGLGTSSVSFAVPASVIGNPDRFDFYVFIRVEGVLDEAPSHVLFSAGSLPWTYPTHSVEAGAAYPVETYVDGSDATLSERPGILIGVVAAGLLGLGAVLAVGGWAVQRHRSRRKGPEPAADG
jgi:hypothetical protein